jgi:hypothetical protein
MELARVLGNLLGSRPTWPEGFSPPALSDGEIDGAIVEWPDGAVRQVLTTFQLQGIASFIPRRRQDIIVDMTEVLPEG